MPPKPFCCTPRHAKHTLGTHCCEKAPLWQAMTWPSHYFRPFELENHRKRTIPPNGCGGTVRGLKPRPDMRGQATSPQAGDRPPHARRDGDGLPGTGRRLKWLPSDGDLLALHSHESSVPLSNTSNTGLRGKSTKCPETIGCQDALL